MVEYEDFRKETLYAIARNGGQLYEQNVRKEFAAIDLDSLDYHLHVRQLLDDGLVERNWTKGSSALDELVLLTRPKESQSYFRLTDTGWDWVRHNRQIDHFVEDEPPPDPE